MRAKTKALRMLFLVLWPILFTSVMMILSCSPIGQPESADSRFSWRNATIYFLMTDRFNNADKENDTVFSRKRDGAVLRNFMGGDIAGITEKIEEGYFTKLGVDAIWFTPVIEQIHGYWEDDWGRSYPFHGYWPLDWTKVDPNFGTEAELNMLIETAHKHGIRVLIDVIINHTGPATRDDPSWPKQWIRTSPNCQWHSYEHNVRCALASSLTDIRTESDKDVNLPEFLLKKWEKEGRKDKELSELDAFFERTQYPRAPKYYIVKWLTDWVREYGVDGFRVDTAKHVEAEIWLDLKTEATLALRDWKNRNPKRTIDDGDFYMIGEVYGFGLLGFGSTPEKSRLYDYGDKKVDFYDYGFDALINMGFPSHASLSYEELFSAYSAELNGGAFSDANVMSYIASHDDPAPYDQARDKPYEAALKLMLAPGAIQLYYGDELARSLQVDGTTGDATLRSFMSWPDLKEPEKQKLLTHWQKLGTFRSAHPAVGAGTHQIHEKRPYLFSRVLKGKTDHDSVLVLIGANKGQKVINSYNIFKNGTRLKDYYSDVNIVVKNGKILVDSPYDVVLLGKQYREQ